METTLVPSCSTGQQSTTITTSLYELIEALQHEVGPENDDLVVATVVYLLRSQHIRFLHNTEPSHCN